MHKLVHTSTTYYFVLHYIFKWFACDYTLMKRLFRLLITLRLVLLLSSYMQWRIIVISKLYSRVSPFRPGSHIFSEPQMLPANSIHFPLYMTASGRENMWIMYKWLRG